MFRWQARILNHIYRTQRYDKLPALSLTKPQDIDYSIFFQMTPENTQKSAYLNVNANVKNNIVQAGNLLCRPQMRAHQMQKQVILFQEILKNMSNKQQQQQTKVPNNSPNFTVEHVVIYSSLSKCKIWPKIVKTGLGLVPTLINFYNTFTKQYNQWLDFKFDPVILSQKYTKIMKKVIMKKKDHPELVKAIKQSDIVKIDQVISQIQIELKQKQPKQQNEQNEQKQDNNNYSLQSHLNNITNNNQLKLCHICIQHSNLQTIKHMHTKYNINFQQLDSESQTAIFYAVKRSDLQIIKYLVQKVKINLNHRECQDRTVIYLAAFQGNLQILQYLYSKGADPSISSRLQRTPLSKACYLGNVKVVKYLLQIKVDYLKQDNKGRTALHNAAWGKQGGRDGKKRGHQILSDSPESVLLLLQHGHPVDVCDNDGFTPLFSAVSSCAQQSMHILISKGASLSHKTTNKQNLCFIASKYGHLTILQQLIQHYHIGYLQKDIHGYSPLCASATLKQMDVFWYISQLYFRDGLMMEVEDVVRCCVDYQTVGNIGYFGEWVNRHVSKSSTGGDGDGDKGRRWEYILRHVGIINQCIHKYTHKQTTTISNTTKQQESTTKQTEDADVDVDVDVNRKVVGMLSQVLSDIVIGYHQIYHKTTQSLQTVGIQLLNYYIQQFNTSSAPSVSSRIVSLSSILPISTNTNRIQINSQHPQSQLIPLLLSPIPLFPIQHIPQLLYKLVKYRRTGAVIAVLNCKDGVCGCSYEEIVGMFVNRGVLEYCIEHGIADMAVYIQQHTVNTHTVNTLNMMNTVDVVIPAYCVQTAPTLQPTQVILHPVQQWCFDLQIQTSQKLKPKQIQKYTQFINNTQQPHILFNTNNKYQVINTYSQISKLWQEIVNQSTIVGIDVEHYNASKEQSFVCSIQVATVNATYVIDPLSHLSHHEGFEDVLTPQEIGQFVNQLMAAPEIVKIFHAYDNDLKWLNQDFGLTQCKNVLDTSRIYSGLKKGTKKGISVGLKTLCSMFLGYQMDKKFQRADWRIRPLFKEMVQYAAIDAEVLPLLYLKMMSQFQERDDTVKLVNSFGQKKIFTSTNTRTVLIPKNEKKNQKQIMSL